MVNLIFYLDIIVTFNTAFYAKGNLVWEKNNIIKISSRKKIAINYLKFWFWLDLLASFPYVEFAELSISDENNKITSKGA